VWANNLEDASWLRKDLTYRELRKSGKLFKHFDLPNFYIFVVAPTKAHVKTMTALTLENTNNSGSDMFCFAPIPVHERKYSALPPMPQLINSPWTRAGRPDFLLTNPK
jgi:hypothetical protein